MKIRKSQKFASLFLLIALVSVSIPTGVYAQSSATIATEQYGSELAAIEAKFEARRKELGVPGVGLAIVRDDKVIYSKGLGYKDLEKKVAVTADTEFAIGSATKAFTALSVLMSQDEGKLSLDDSPKKALPYFKMYDPDTDKNITIRDLLSHSSGLNRTDLAMITGKLTRAELIQVAAQAKPTAKLREKFQYQNIMFAAAGEIVANVQKTPWEKFVPKRILKPIGMDNTTMSMVQMQKAKDYSFGYDYNLDTKETKRLPFREIGEVAPAGSINSSANDMAKWLRFILNGGTVNGKRLVSESGFDEWLKPQNKISGKMAYGLGWFLQEWNGLKVVQHGGNIDGFTSLVGMIPEKKVGFVILTNASNTSLANEMMPVIWQELLGEKKADEAVKLPLKTMEKMAGKYMLAEAKVEIEVKIVGEDLIMAVPGQPEYTLERTAPREFSLLGAPSGFSVKFTPEQGDATEMLLTQPQGNFTLKRITDATVKEEKTVTAAPDPAKELIGRYSTPSGKGTVTVKQSDSGGVTLNIEGQQPYTLKERSKDAYSLSPLPEGYSLKAKRDEAGKVVSVIVAQPEGENEFKRLEGDSGKPDITASELEAKVIAAVGGETNWRKITSRTYDFDMDLENQGVQGFGRSNAKAPNLAATETTFTALGKTIGTEWEYFDGTGGADALSFAPAEKYTGKRLDDLRLAYDFYALLNWKTNFKKIEVTGIAKVGDEDAYTVSFEPEKGTPFTEYYSTKTFLLLKRTGVIPLSSSSTQIPYTVNYSDYRDVDGIKLPFKQVNNSIANGNIVITVKSVKHNESLDDKMFGPKK